MATIDQVLRAVAPKADTSFIAAAVKCDAGAIMTRHGLDADGQAILIAHMAHETQGFTRFEENLNYSAARLHQVWPRRFPSIDAAAPLARNPKALALNVYGGRVGNRPNTTDGWDYRGSGALQHTGRDEFERVDRRAGIRVLDFPDRLRKPDGGAATWLAACTYLVDRGAVGAANAGDVPTTTRKVNGGENGLDDRRIRHARARQAIGGMAIASGSSKVDITSKPAEKTSDEDARQKQGQATGGAVVVSSGGAAAGAGGGPDGFAPGVWIALLLVACGLAIALLVRRAMKAKAAVETQEIDGLRTRAG